jgi:hypothetical protein
MRLLKTNALRTAIVAAVAGIEFAVVTHRPEFWIILAFALAALALACDLWSKQQPMTVRPPGKPDSPTVTAMGLPRVRFSLRRMMIAVVLVAVVLWPVHLWLYWPYYEAKAKFHGLMAQLCEAEAKLMTERAEQCLARSTSGAPWDDASDEAEVLKICPYPSDGPRYGSWLEQSAVWQRAARKSARVAQRHSRIGDYYSGWDVFPPWER